MDPIADDHLVTDVYGAWPSFAGARFHALAIRRDEVLLTLHTWKGAEDHCHPDAPIPLGAEHLHRLVTLAFEEPEDVSFSGLDCSNQEVHELAWRDGRLEVAGTFRLSLSSSRARVVEVRRDPLWG